MIRNAMAAHAPRIRTTARTASRALISGTCTVASPAGHRRAVPQGIQGEPRTEPTQVSSSGQR
jgi:hypothetical protein